MHDNPPSPDEEAEIDRQIHIENMKAQLDRIAGGNIHSGAFGPVSSEMEESFLERVLAYEQAELDTDFNRLVQRGVAIVPPAELDDTALSATLSEVIRTLGQMRCFLYHTDHLSDRELYDWLWSSGLRDETPDLSGMPDACYHTSPIGAGSDEDTAIGLKYYADEAERERWHLEFPNEPIPAHEPLPFDRDRHLPKRPAF